MRARFRPTWLPPLYVAAAAPTMAQTPPAQHPSNREISAIFEADQAARQDVSKIDWAATRAQDAIRRSRTKALLDAGALKSADDFYNAAFVFQHGDTAADCLLAHSLAVLSAARGRRDAAWIAAATLDRYLQRIGQPQIYGTQYLMPPGGPATQAPYDRSLISDALRAEFGVPDQKEQEKRRAELEAQVRARGAE